MIKNIPIIFFSAFLYCCSGNHDSIHKRNKSIESYSDVFKEIEKIFSDDNGDFWNHSLNGPILLVDPVTRMTFSNQRFQSDSYLSPDGIYIDTLPENLNIANTALEWEDKRWAMLKLPLSTDPEVRNNLIIHEVFHRIQPEVGFDSLYEVSNTHLDGLDGRLLLKLELEALVDAVHSKRLDQITRHLKNALFFRHERHETSEIAHAENNLELNEGLAEYTGLMLSQRSHAEIMEHFRQSTFEFYKNETFVRSFAYQTIPMYGYLLSKYQSDWHKEVTKNSDLTHIFEEAFGFDPRKNSSVEDIAKTNDYNYFNILSDEKKREEVRLERIERLKNLFLNEPTLKLHFENMNISFDPRNLIPIENIGTVYQKIRISDNWGVLDVEDVALLSEDWTHVVLSEPIEIEDKIITGNGWKLILNNDWKVVKENNSYELDGRFQKL